MESPPPNAAGKDLVSLDYVRETLIRQEDSIVFSLIERAKYKRNAAAYESSSLAEFFVRQSEKISAKVGRYLNPEEVPFFKEDLPEPVVHLHSFPEFLHPSSASVNVSKKIWKIYTKELTNLIAEEGDDGDYGSTVAADLVCLQVGTGNQRLQTSLLDQENEFDLGQALSRRIHYGRFVAEVKFRDTPDDYIPLIKSKDREGLLKLLTFADVEEEVKRRVKKKAMVFGQEVKLDEKSGGVNKGPKFKVDPEVVARIYGEWVIPFTKAIQVDYLLRRLN